MNVISVTQLNAYIKALIEESQNLKRIYVQGEISNFTNHYQSGHMYFSLKDNKSQVKCVMFATFAKKIKFRPENGLKVLLKARVSVYEANGQYQLYVEDMQPDGLGSLNLAYEQLKAKLEKEGLFRNDIKKPLPKYPSKIGIITSPTGAAIEDMLRILKNRWSLAEVLFCPCTVQGETAPAQLVASLKTLERQEGIDLIIIGRGGGSTEDLWAFNDERLARAIHACKVPVVSAVGHENDFAISDFVADLRAGTPSIAAQLCTPDIQDEMDDVLNLRATLNYFQQRKIDDYSMLLDNISNIDGLIENRFKLKEKQLDMLNSQLGYTSESYLQKLMLDYSKLNEKLDALSPLKVLTRGFSLLEKDENTVSSVTQLSEDEILTATLKDGKAKMRVVEIL